MIKNTLLCLLHYGNMILNINSPAYYTNVFGVDDAVNEATLAMKENKPPAITVPALRPISTCQIILLPLFHNSESR